MIFPDCDCPALHSPAGLGLHGNLSTMGVCWLACSSCGEEGDEIPADVIVNLILDQPITVRP